MERLGPTAPLRSVAPNSLGKNILGPSLSAVLRVVWRPCYIAAALHIHVPLRPLRLLKVQNSRYHSDSDSQSVVVDGFVELYCDLLQLFNAACSL